MIEVYEATKAADIDTIFDAARQMMRDLQRILAERGLSPDDAAGVLSLTGAAGAIISDDPDNFPEMMDRLRCVWKKDGSAPFGISLSAPKGEGN